MTELTVRDYSDVYRLGASDERERIVERLKGYLDLTEFSENVEGAEPTALALINGETAN